MLCEHNKKALIEAVAAEQPLPPEVQARVDTCTACSATLAREQLLFASIDAGIRTRANAELPQSLVPTLRVRIAHEPSVQSRQSVAATLGYAALAAVLLLALLPLGLRQFRGPKVVYESAAKPSATNNELSSKKGLAPTSSAASARSQVHRTKALLVRTVRQSENPLRLGKPEVLVPPDQELLLARYAEALRTRSWVLDARAESKTATLGSPIELIELAELRFSLLPSLAAQ